MIFVEEAVIGVMFGEVQQDVVERPLLIVLTAFCWSL
jgi:hypothetical protein